MSAAPNVNVDRLASMARRLAGLVTTSRMMAQHPQRQRLERKMEPNFNSASPNADQDDFLSLEIELARGSADPRLPGALKPQLRWVLGVVDQQPTSGDLAVLLRAVADHAPLVVERLTDPQVQQLYELLIDHARLLSRRLSLVEAANETRSKAVTSGWAKPAEMVWILELVLHQRVTKKMLKYWRQRGYVKFETTDEGVTAYDVESVLEYARGRAA